VSIGVVDDRISSVSSTSISVLRGREILAEAREILRELEAQHAFADTAA
jgi:hypothetical protein